MSDLVLFDVNALVALSLTSHQQHHAAHRFLSGHSGRWATTPITESALFRLLLNPAVTGRDISVHEVSRLVRGLRMDQRWCFLDDHTTLADPVVNTTVLMGHRQVTDLHLVNLAAHHSAVMATFDATMARWIAPEDRHHLLVIPQ